MSFSLDFFILILAAIALAWYLFITLSGVEGWALSRSLTPWFAGFFFGAASMMGLSAIVFFAFLKFEAAHPAPWIAGGATGLVMAFIFAKVYVSRAWRALLFKMFMKGFLLGVLVYYLKNGAFWEAGADVMAYVPVLATALIFGAFFLVLYRWLFPALWLVKNGALMTLAAALLVSGALRGELADFIRGDAGDFSADVLSGHALLFFLTGAGFFGLTALFMFVQRFGSKYKRFLKEKKMMEMKKVSLGNMTEACLESLAGNFAAAFSLKRSSPDALPILEFTSPIVEQKSAPSGGPRGGKRTGPAAPTPGARSRLVYEPPGEKSEENKISAPDNRDGNV